MLIADTDSEQKLACLCEVTRALQWHDTVLLGKVTPKAMRSILEAAGWREGSTEFKAVDKKMLPINTEFIQGNPEDPEVITIPLQQNFKDYYLRVIEWATSFSEYYHNRSSAELIAEALIMENKTIDTL